MPLNTVTYSFGLAPFVGRCFNLALPSLFSWLFWLGSSRVRPSAADRRFIPLEFRPAFLFIPFAPLLAFLSLFRRIFFGHSLHAMDGFHPTALPIPRDVALSRCRSPLGLMGSRRPPVYSPCTQYMHAFMPFVLLAGVELRRRAACLPACVVGGRDNSPPGWLSNLPSPSVQTKIGAPAKTSKARNRPSFASLIGRVEFAPTGPSQTSPLPFVNCEFYFLADFR
ncbi:hypothetical protein B0T26DRAFT_400852 [Lasiosphaeria miniovina]|uniref:Transmembrane protein n=1 Tax=Lasiosphaeria miniovina TaxID=1954250 RepID=A0AA40A4R6_9PEZI|nr:uncharacterized protein B0T26DRAFT_400852 [Lasiosphaeria miniovina]KAK0709301.1 hypothetical protein B0T26DRAFT_400852 [Lasiosphaeria miniovina]